jgi:lipopolysaccharide heptosyltransferase II
LLAGLEDWREGAPVLYDTSVPRPSHDTHAVDWYLALIHRLGVPTGRPFDWFPRTQRGADLLQASWPEASGSIWVGFQPGARWDTKRWPAAYYAQLAEKLIAARPEVQIAIFGGKADRAMGDEIASRCGNRVLNLTGRISLNVLVEWMRSIRLLVTNDTGPMHIAAAMGKPIVALFGPTDPDRTGPYRQPEAALQANLPCVPCMKDKCRWPEKLACLHALTVDHVLERTLERLEH